MTDSVTQQILSIHSMLSAGHRNLRIERHTLVLWGLAGSALVLASESVLTTDQFPDVARRATAWLLLLSAVLGAVGALDWHLTRRAKRHRDEAWSFIHRQVLKVWWLLMALGTLLTFAMFFFGGGFMVCAAWTVLAGLGLYVHGLFSEELLEWTGVLGIAIGIGSLAYGLDYETTRWIAASLFGIGLPLLAVMLDRGRERSAVHRAAQSAVWLVAVLGIPLVLHLHVGTVPAPEGAPVTLDRFLKGEGATGRHVVTIPPGTPVPVEVTVTGNLFRNGPAVVLPLTLAVPLEVATEDGRPTGTVRYAGENWVRGAAGVWLSIPSLAADLTEDRGPVVRVVLETDTAGERRR